MDILFQILKESYQNKDLKKQRENSEEDQKLQSPTLSLDQRPNFNNLLNKNMTKEDLTNVFGRKWKISLGVLGALVDYYQYVVTTKNYTPYIISVYNKALNSFFKNKSNVQNAINLAERVGLLYCSFDKVSFTRHLAKEYYYNKDMERIIKSLVDKYDINYKKTVVNNIVDISSIGDNIRKDDTFNVKICSKLRIAGMTDSEVLQRLSLKYRHLGEFQQLFNEMNEDLPLEQQTRYTPNITRSKKGYVTKIGIRATNSICSLKEHENENKDYTGKWRKDYLDELFGKNNWYENDVKSSVPRVAYLMKTGEWLDQSIDMYEMIFNKKFKSRDDEERLIYKDFFMRFYFDYAGCLYKNNKEYFPEADKKYGKESCTLALMEAKSRVEDVLGKSLDSEIFYHESNIYGLFAKYLRDKGIKVVQIYDAVYSNVDTRQFNNILKEIAEEYFISMKLSNNNVVEEVESIIKYNENINIRSSIGDNIRNEEEHLIQNFLNNDKNSAFWLRE